MSTINLSNVINKPIDFLYHISDIHVNLQKRHTEFREVFDKLYHKLNEFKKQNKNGLIMVTGDVLNSKNIMTPELIVLVQEFFGHLAKIFPVILIAGNHDAILTNNDRVDSLTPLVFSYSQPNKRLINNRSDKYENFYYLRESGLYRYNNLIFSVASVFDSVVIPAKDIVHQPTDIKIALHHGTLDGASTELGHVLKSHLSVSDFEGYDAVLLGDIHKYQYLDERKRICYPGSLLQLNHGETLHNHGVLVWDLKTFETKLHEIENDYGFCTITIRKNKIVKAPNQIPKKPRMRYRVDLSTDDQKFAEIRQDYRDHYLIQEEVIDNLAVWGEKMTHENLVEEEHNTQEPEDISSNLTIDILNPSIQKQLIVDYLKDKKVEPEMINKLLTLNHQINEEVTSNEKQNNESNIIHTTGQQLKWKIMTLNFSNMFSYGENNMIDFTQFNQISGIFGDNAIGKSAILDVLLFTLFDKCSRGERADVLNKKKNHFECELIFTVGCNNYRIHRKGLKQTKSVKGEKKTNVRIDVIFEKMNPNGSVDNLTGQDRNDTNKKIRELLGSYEDFLMSSFLLQKGSDKFLKMAQVDQKLRLYDLFKLNWFEKMYSLAKSKLDYYNHKIKELEKLKVNELLASNESELKIIESEMTPNVTQIHENELSITQLNEQIDQLKNQLIQIQSFDESLQQIDQSLQTHENHYLSLLKQIEQLNSLMNHNQVNLSDIELSQMTCQMIELEQNIKGLELKRSQFQSSINNRQLQLDSYNHMDYESNLNQLVNESQIIQNELSQLMIDQENLNEKLNQAYNDHKLSSTDTKKQPLDIIHNQIEKIKIGKDKLLKKYEQSSKKITILHSRKQLLINIDQDKLKELQTNRQMLFDCIESNQKRLLQLNQVELIDYNQKLKLKDDKLRLLEQIRYQIKSIKASSHKLLLVKHDPNCEYCVNNIFVVEAKQCHNQLSELESNENQLKIEVDELDNQLANMNTIHLINELNQTLKINRHELMTLDKDISKINKEISNNQLIERNNDDLEKEILEMTQICQETMVNIPQYELALETKLKIKDELTQFQNSLINLLNQIKLKGHELDKHSHLIKQLNNLHQLYELNQSDHVIKLTIESNLNELAPQLNDIKQILKTHHERLTNQLRIDKLQSESNLIFKQLEELRHQKKIYLQNVELIDQNNAIEQQLKQLFLDRGRMNVKACVLNKNKEQLIIKKTILETKIQQYLIQVAELSQLNDDLLVYQEYCQCLGKNGLPHELLMKIINRISEIANNILKQIADFTIEFTDDKKKLSICIHRNGIQQSTDMTSGFEEFVIELSLKIAFSMVSNVARPNFLAIDEGFGCLDSDHLSSLTSVLNFIKTKFDFILIITHINELKSQGDYYIHIKKLNNSDKDSYVNNQKIIAKPVSAVKFQTPKLKAPKLKLKV